MDAPVGKPGARRVAAIVAASVLGLGAIVGVAALLELGPFAPEPLSERGLVAEGDEICKRAHDRFAGAQDEAPATAAQAVLLTGELVEIAEDEQEQLDELEAPPALEDELDRYLSAHEEGVDQLRAGLDAAREKDSDAYERAQAELARGQLERRRLAQAVGFSECSRPAGAST